MVYDVRIAPMPLQAMIDLKGNAATIGRLLRRIGLPDPAPGRATNSARVQAIRAGREHWLVRGRLDQEGELLSMLSEDAAAGDTLVLAVSDAYAFFGIAGPEARQVMAVASPLDTDLLAFPADGATFTEAFGQKALVLRSFDGFEIAFERSYMSMASDYWSRICGGLSTARATTRNH